MNEFVLVHHGVKGQKWGVRKTKNATGTPKQKKTKRKKTNAKSKMGIGTKIVRTGLGVIGAAMCADILYNDFRGIKAVGRGIISGALRLRGDTNIRWVD